MGNNRIVFIDQLKGLAMLAVVFNHLLQFCFGVNYTTTNTMLAIFDLPLFFFISGYFCYKERVFNVKETLSLLSKKFKNYVFPFLSVGLLYCFLFKQSVTDMILDGGGRFWFLPALFEISVICILLNQLSNTFQRKKRFPLIDILIYLVPYLILVVGKLYWKDAPAWLHIDHMVTYYRHFVLGMMVKKYANFEGFLTKQPWIYALCFVFYLLGVKYIEQHNMVLIFMSQAGSIVLLWVFFQQLKTRNIVTRCLEIVGGHTLGIYVFHYFLLFDLKWLSSYISYNNFFTLHLMLCLVSCCVIIPCCILIESMLSKNKYLSIIFLGK